MKTKEETMREAIGEESSYTPKAMYAAFKEIFEKGYEAGYDEGYEEAFNARLQK
jgi:flagellar biosynthesis/type III secretory pathway protein FliH